MVINIWRYAQCLINMVQDQTRFLGTCLVGEVKQFWRVQQFFIIKYNGTQPYIYMLVCVTYNQSYTNK